MKELCPLCSNTLLRHLHQSEITWFCPRCRQEMPNLDFSKFDAVKENFLPTINCQDNQEISYLKHKTMSKAKIVTQQLTVLDSLINEEKKRLAVVNFIRSQNELIILKRVTDTIQDITNTKIKLNESNTKICQKNKLSKADFLKDSEIILVSICQAILVRDISALNNQRLQTLKAKYAELNISVDQIVCLICLIKTSVLDFISSISFDSSESFKDRDALFLNSEVASYFDVVISSINLFHN